MKGVVVAPQPQATEIGARVLEQGGNAFDAIVATAFAQMVLDPFMCGPGGMGTALIYSASTRETQILDFYGRAGSRVTPHMWHTAMRGRTAISGYTLFDDFRSELGYSSIMTPGSVAGFAQLHQKYCSRPWKDLLDPAINIARNGFTVPPFLADFLHQAPQEGVPDGYRRVTTSKACAKIYLRKDQTLIQAGDILQNPDMAQTLQTLAEEGPEAFYSGSISEMILEDLQAHDAFMTREDLRSYQVRVGSPLVTTYRGCKIVSNPPPGGGPWILEALNILDGFTLGSMDHNGAEHLHVLATAMKLAHEDRNVYLGDPEYIDVPLSSVFLSKSRAKEHQKSIRLGTWQSSQGSPKPGSETTHLIAVDSNGNIASVTHTLGTGSGVITPGLGFIYNNSMKLFDPVPGTANSIESGKARTTGMCPTIVFKDDHPLLTLGAPGGSVIMSAVLQSISNVIDFGMTATEAVSAPRIHAEGQIVYVEARIREDVCHRLQKMGHDIEHLVNSYAPTFSKAQMVRFSNDGRLDGASDPRGGGGVTYEC